MMLCSIWQALATGPTTAPVFKDNGQCEGLFVSSSICTEEADSDPNLLLKSQWHFTWDFRVDLGSSPSLPTLKFVTSGLNNGDNWTDPADTTLTGEGTVSGPF